MRSRLLVYLFLAMFLACTVRPNYVISDKKMANVLFDLYLVETVITENSRVFYNDSAKKQELLQSVFKKHKISQARFDTSLVWFNANLKEYLKINTLVTERYEQWIAELHAEEDRIKKALARIEGNKLRFEDMNIQDFVTPLLSFLPADSLTLPVDTICTDTILNPLEAIPLFERYCFYEEEE